MRGLSKTRTGVIVSNKMDKTVVVATVRITKHSLYKKYIKKRVRYKAHDQGNTCRIGDTVLIKECRPLSKDKRWKVVEIVKRAV
ncbi:MAG: 30S ribosomal protein S17 [Proteobacteria bacterium]|nr:30S ribosomal protein S17 [Pseudomonadota bacterium]